MAKLGDIELPMIFKNRKLFSYGFFNNLNIDKKEVEGSIFNTDWKDDRNKSLYIAHSERNAQKWVGRISNPQIVDGSLFGDLEVHDADLAMKLGPGKAPLGISAEIKWPPQYDDPVHFSYKGFAVVPNPEVDNTMVNQPTESTVGFSSATIITPYSDNSALFSEEKETVVDPKEEPVEEVEEKTEKKEDLMSAERGFDKKMEEKNANNIETEVKEEVVEVVESKEETTEEPESNNAEFSKLVEKVDALFVKMEALEANQAKFSEESKKAKEEETEEEVVETKETTEEPKEVIEEEESTDEVVEETKTEEEKSEVVEESEAKFSELAEQVGNLVTALNKKEAAPMSTAEFGAKGLDKDIAVIDRLTQELSN